jgi:hypothetical protein
VAKRLDRGRRDDPAQQERDQAHKTNFGELAFHALR